MPDVFHIPWIVIYWLDFIAVAQFFISYYRKCYRQGYRIDFWHAQVFLSVVLPNMLMLPFAKSELNIISVGNDMPGIIEVLPTVFLISLLGYVAILAGGGLWRLQAGLGIRKTAINLLDVVPKCSRLLMSSRSVLVFQSLVCVILQVSILGYYFSHNGFGFSLREYTFENPSLRPIALLISNYSIIIASHSLARYIDTKERILLMCTLMQTLGLVFFGSRGSLLSIYFTVLLCYFMKRRTSISLLRIAGIGLVLIIIAFYLGVVRSGDYAVDNFWVGLIVVVLYGNNFSDLRDFAWVYSKWDNVLWHGKTYLAAVLSFVPRFASTFRDNWALGVATSSTAGLDPQVHPGLRPGIFGEGFFNFGILGVVVMGLMFGIILRRVDLDVKLALTSSPRPMRMAFASTIMLGIALTLVITSGFSSLYILAGVYAFSWLCLTVERIFRPESFGSKTGRMASSRPVAE